jgi:DNA-binding transcriptional regulator PaaX
MKKANNITKQAEHKNKKNDIILTTAKIILAVLWEIGQITTKSFFPSKYAKMYGYSSLNSERYHNSLHNLNRNGFVRRGNNGIYRLTKDGERKAFFAYLDAKSSKYKAKKQTWDKKWRIIFFDIPEEKRHLRDYLRTILRAIGFKEFQKSIWIYPYKIPLFLKDLLFEERIKQYTRFVTTYDIEYDKDIKKMFKLE